MKICRDILRYTRGILKHIEGMQRYTEVCRDILKHIEGVQRYTEVY